MADRGGAELAELEPELEASELEALERIEKVLGEQQETLGEIHRWIAAHDGRIDVLWATRTAQDTVDRDTFAELRGLITALETKQAVIQTRLGWACAVLGIAGGVIVQFVSKAISGG